MCLHCCDFLTFYVVLTLKNFIANIVTKQNSVNVAYVELRCTLKCYRIVKSPEGKQYLLMELVKGFEKFLAFSNDERASIDPNGDLERAVKDALQSAEALKSVVGSSDR